MTQVNFYIQQRLSQQLLACKIVAKGWQQGSLLYLHTEDSLAAAKIDDLLWCFDDVSFLPHQRLNERSDAEGIRIYIGYGDQLLQRPQLIDNNTPSAMVNLADTPTPPACFSRFDKVAEVVPLDENGKQLARARYRYYQERGYPMQTHNL
ncbi:DNA polymerase III subunit chi [Ectothiorhodospiraceae bacterium BW-2]|nr:DNA polymerase III subunit chi [Ectothiorhodospiraceae bacterium BW-2]